jgi:anti-anti-sigma factor
MTTILRAPPATVVLDGEIDIATSPAIWESLMAAINAGNLHLAVDMSGVAFIDAAGIGVLVAAANRAREAGGGLSLLAPSWQVRRPVCLVRHPGFWRGDMVHRREHDGWLLHGHPGTS